MTWPNEIYVEPMVNPRRQLRALADEARRLDLERRTAGARTQARQVAVADNRLPEMPHTETSRAMRTKALPKAGSLRLEVYEVLRVRGPLTDYELADLLGRSHQSLSGCRNGLVKDGFLEVARDEEGEVVQRINEFGNPARAWRVFGG